jgi:O-antigen/teichoic acid export membrane protein
MFKKIVYSSFVIGIAVFIFIYFAFPLFGIGQFYNYWPLAIIIILSNFFTLISALCSHGLASRRLDIHYAFTGLVGLCMSLLFNAFFIKFWGLYGAAISIILTNIIQSLVKIYFLRIDDGAK